MHRSSQLNRWHFPREPMHGFAPRRPLSELPLEPRFAQLGHDFVSEVPATPLPRPVLAHFNRSLALSLGMDVSPAGAAERLAVLSGNRPWPGYAALASVYAGHQFGTWVPQLGDGRAHLIAEVRTPGGAHMELQLKGSGPTPYSRGMDGRAVLRSSIREYLCSEAMHALGVPTTRCLSLVSAPEPVFRETTETAAVVCRVAPSFVRFGHFEYIARSGKPEALARLADHVIAGHFPALTGRSERYAEWLGEVVERTARLMAQWQALGFCHGVMNTDNFSVLGLTLDYGPYGFMDRFRKYHVCNHSDAEGRYAYYAQPEIGQWNCARLLQACLPLLGDESAAALERGNELLARYAPAYSTAMRRWWADKLGLFEVREADEQLVNGWLSVLQTGKGDFTRSFRSLASVTVDAQGSAGSGRDELLDVAAYDAWLQDYRARLRAEQNLDDARRAFRMNRVNPKYVLRNHLAQAAIDGANAGDFRELETLLNLLTRPFDEQPRHEAYAEAPPDELRHIEVSCSS